MKKMIKLNKSMLRDVTIVEKFTKDNSMYYTKKETVNKLKNKMSEQTIKNIINYLEKTGKIDIDNDGIISYMWNPELLEKIKNMKDIKI